MSRLDVVGRLKEACSGLQFVSESDYPFEVFVWEGQAGVPSAPEKIAQHTGHPADVPVEVVGLSDFFKPATEEQEWYGAEEKETTARFRNLAAAIADQLSDVKVYRVGQVEIDVYIMGTCGNDLVGLSTKVVET